MHIRATEGRAKSLRALNARLNSLNLRLSALGD